MQQTAWKYALFGIASSSLFIIIGRRRVRKDELLSLSFKLRTQLETVVGYANILNEDNQLQFTNPEQKRYLEYILTGSKDILTELTRLEDSLINTPDYDAQFNFRTGLNTILGYAEIIYDDLIGSSNKQQKGYMKNILMGGKEISNLIAIRG
jgi:hypothetical protein